MTHRATREATNVDSFTTFVETNQPKLRQALVAIVGPDLAADALSETLLYCWRNWSRIRHMSNPTGYVWSVGRSKGRDLLRQQGRWSRRDGRLLAPSPKVSTIEPELPRVMRQLSERQRTAVLLVHGFDWSYPEVARFLDITVPTVQKHTERGLAKLRRALGVER